MPKCIADSFKNMYKIQKNFDIWLLHNFPPIPKLLHDLMVEAKKIIILVYAQLGEDGPRAGGQDFFFVLLIFIHKALITL